MYSLLTYIYINIYIQGGAKNVGPLEKSCAI